MCDKCQDVGVVGGPEDVAYFCDCETGEGLGREAVMNPKPRHSAYYNGYDEWLSQAEQDRDYEKWSDRVDLAAKEAAMEGEYRG